MTKLFLFIGIVVAAVAPVAMTVWPERGEPVVVVSAPWSGPGGAVGVVARADGRLLTADDMVSATAISNDDAFVMRLFKGGALMVLSARGVAACRAFMGLG